MNIIAHYYGQYKKFKHFLGKYVWFLFRLSFFVGLFWFAVESSFIFVLQAFLIAIGLVDEKNTFLPAFFPTSPKGAILTLLAFGLLRATAIFLRQYFSEIANQSFVKTQRDRIIEYSLSQTADLSTSDVLNVFNEQIPSAAQVVQGVSSTLNTVVSSGLLLLLGARLAPIELTIAMTSLYVLFLMLKFINQRIRNLGKSLFLETRRLTEALVIGLRNHFLLKVYNLTNKQIENGRKASAAYEHFFRRYILLSSLKSSFPQFAGAVVICLVCFVSREYIHTSSAKLISFIYIFMRLAQSFSDLSAILLNMRFKWDTFKELYGWYTQGEVFLKSKNEDSITISRNESKLVNAPINFSLNNLAFRYDESEPLFSNLNLVLSPGGVLLLKGPSGSGKSTLLTLLLGIQKPTSGTVMVNGESVDKMRIHLAPFTAYVGPEPYMIQGTVRENLLYANDRTDEVMDNELWAVIAQAQLSSLIQKHEKGLDRELKEVTEFSTGQKQRIALARALLRKPKVLILDEATANLDAVTEREIISVIRDLSSDISMIVVSHKDSFDRIATETIDLGSHSV